MENDEPSVFSWEKLKYVFGVVAAFVLGRILVAGILPTIFPELADLGGQGWVVNAIGAVFVLGLWALYQHRGVWLAYVQRFDVAKSESEKKADYHKLQHDARLYRRIYGMCIDVMPMLGLFGTVIGLTRFLPSWVQGNPDTAAVKYSFLATGAGIILSATLTFLDGIIKVPFQEPS